MRYEHLGTNDDRNECGLCGKPGLKSVMWIKDNETGDIFYAGSSCGRKMLGYGAKQFKKYLKEQNEILAQKIYKFADRSEQRQLIKILEDKMRENRAEIIARKGTFAEIKEANQKLSSASEEAREALKAAIEKQFPYAIKSMALEISQAVYF